MIPKYVRRYRIAFPIAFVLTSAASVLAHARGTEGALEQILLLVPFFLAGVVLHQYKEWFPINGYVASVSGVLLGACLAFGVGQALAPLPLAYLLLWIGIAAPAWLRHVGRKNDFSYGDVPLRIPRPTITRSLRCPELGLGRLQRIEHCRDRAPRSRELVFGREIRSAAEERLAEAPKTGEGTPVLLSEMTNFRA